MKKLLILLLILLILFSFAWIGRKEGMAPQFPNYNDPPSGLLVTNGVIQDEYFAKTLQRMIQTAYDSGIHYNMSSLDQDVRQQLGPTFYEILSYQYGGLKQFMELKLTDYSKLDLTSRR